MIRIYLKYLIQFIAVVLIQVMIMDNIEFSGYLNPFFYTLFILLLPFETPGWLLLITAFLLGFFVDLFNGVPGMHASASVFMAFFRPGVLKFIAPHDGYVNGTSPRLSYYGIEWFARYSFFLILIHGIFLFFIETFSLSFFFNTLLRAFMSTILTGILIILSQYFLFRK